MTEKDIFFKYVSGFKCTREEYLIAQNYLSSLPLETKLLYERNMEIIVKSLISSKAISDKLFLAKARKHGLTKAEALLLIDNYISKQEDEMSLVSSSRK